MQQKALGETEQLVLATILHLGDDAYGTTIMQEIGARTGREVSRAAIYIALRRMEAKGLVTTWLGPPAAERGGKPRRYARVEPLGIARLKEARSVLTRIWAGLEPALGDQ